MLQLGTAAGHMPLTAAAARVISRGEDTQSVISLNVGGKNFDTYRATLTQFPDSMLAALMNRPHFHQSHNGGLFIDRDGELFEHVLDFLRSGPDFELPSDSRTCRYVDPQPSTRNPE